MSELDPHPAPSNSEEALEPLPPATRIALWIVGTVFLLIGLVGLALPVVPQAVPLAIGAAFLSLASERFYSLLVRKVERWPKLARRLVQLRHRMHRLLSRLHGRRGPERSRDPRRGSDPARLD
ncbi:MAG TPA: hypothetical protein VMV46_05610 [Thermoanaerobaculia bacterium]|nr:hypothetical protein [Thermoanaerobaculia bacterium]